MKYIDAADILIARGGFCFFVLENRKVLSKIKTKRGIAMIRVMLGCNYWDSVSGTDMCKNWNEDVVRADLAALRRSYI